jgi:hypothetical protein
VRADGEQWRTLAGRLLQTGTLRILIATKENIMKPSTKDEVAGKIHEAKGTVKEKVGKLTNNPNLARVKQ